MPRKSEAALSIPQPRVNARLEDVSPPSNMPANHKRIFIDLVHSMPPNIFARATFHYWLAKSPQ